MKLGNFGLEVVDGFVSELSSQATWCDRFNRRKTLCKVTLTIESYAIGDVCNTVIGVEKIIHRFIDAIIHEVLKQILIDRFFKKSTAFASAEMDGFCNVFE